MPPNYPEQAQAVLTRLFVLDLTPERLMKIGAFIVTYGLFETSLERAIWSLKGMDVKGIRPFTEKLSSNDWLKKLGEGNPELSDECNLVLQEAAVAAVDLADYRHSIVHGQLIAVGGAPWFLRNPAWHGEKRNKPPGDASTEEPLLDLAIVSASTLYKVVRSAETAITNPEAQDSIEQLLDDVRHEKATLMSFVTRRVFGLTKSIRRNCDV